MADGRSPLQGGAAPQAAPPRHHGGLIWMVVALVTIAVVVLAVVLVAFTGGKSSPEKAFENFVDAVNDKDGARMLNNTILRFSPEYDELIEDFMNGSPDEQYEITINSLVTLGDDELTQDQKDDAEELVAQVEVAFDIDVQDYSYVRYNITEVLQTIEGDLEEYDSDDMLCFEVNGKWYIVPEHYFEEY